MELTRQIQDLYNTTEDEYASNLQDEEINIILELVKMGRMDINEFDKIIKNSVTGWWTFCIKLGTSIVFVAERLNSIQKLIRNFVCYRWNIIFEEYTVMKFNNLFFSNTSAKSTGCF